MIKKYLRNTYVIIKKFFNRINPGIIKGCAAVLLTGVIICVCFLPIPQKAAMSSVLTEADGLEDKNAASEALLELGANGAEVVKLQKRLHQLGYYNGYSTGLYDAGTAKAVLEFQRQNELMDSGKADYSTVEMLFNEENPSQASAADERYEYGDSGSEVALIQRGLAVAGYFESECAGVFGLATRKAVMQFQADNSLLATGKVSGETYGLLKEIAQPGTEKTYSEVGARSDEKAIIEVQQALADLKYISADNITGYYGNITQNALKKFQKQFSIEQTGEADAQTLNMLFYVVDYRGLGGSAQPKYETVKQGDRGSAVRDIQEALKKLGYFNGNITDYYGEVTSGAVKAFQDYVGLPDSGIANSKTQDKLYSLASKMPAKLKSYKMLEKEDESIGVRRVQSGLKQLGYFKGSLTSYYGSKTYEAVRAFQRAKGLTVTGKADIATQRLLFSLAPDAEDIQVIEKIKWFNDAKNLFKTGTTAKIIDVTTGKSFTVKRTGGYYHADVEPVKASDTAVMKKMMGGKWSWNRRPIIVVYNGRYLAASMNGMPHSFDKISGNNFSGHFCIHFAGSKTHASGKVDAAHQAAVAKAYANGYKVLE